MPKQPIESYDKSKSSEIMDYIMDLMVPMINMLNEKKVDKADLADLKRAANMFAEHKDACKDAELIQAVNILSSKVDDLTTRVKALEDAE
jgi:hypothetical protein